MNLAQAIRDLKKVRKHIFTSGAPESILDLLDGVIDWLRQCALPTENKNERPHHD
jgi:hypothetical protein